VKCQRQVDEQQIEGAGGQWWRLRSRALRQAYEQVIASRRTASKVLRQFAQTSFSMSQIMPICDRSATIQQRARPDPQGAEGGGGFPNQATSPVKRRTPIRAESRIKKSGSNCP
jgi:hypothetical protein